MREIGIILGIAVFTHAAFAELPEEAERHMARGYAAVKAAEDEAGFTRAAAEFAKALEYASDTPEIYYNLGITEDKAGNYNAAMAHLEKYLALEPQAPDAREVKNLIYEIEYRQEEKMRQDGIKAGAAMAQAVKDKAVARAQNSDLVMSLTGSWFQDRNDGGIANTEHYQVTASSTTAFKIKYIRTQYYSEGIKPGGSSIEYVCTADLDTRQITCQKTFWHNYSAWGCKHPYETVTVYGTISKDGRQITITEDHQVLNPSKCRWEYQPPRTVVLTKY